MGLDALREGRRVTEGLTLQGVRVGGSEAVDDDVEVIRKVVGELTGRTAT